MKVVLGASLAFALITGNALAQTAPQVPPPAPAGNDGLGAPHYPPPPPPPGNPVDDMGHGRMWRHAMRPQIKAARFHIESGDMKVGVKCAEDEPTKVCADFTLQLLDKLGSITQR